MHTQGFCDCYSSPALLVQRVSARFDPIQCGSMGSSRAVESAPQSSHKTLRTTAGVTALRHCFQSTAADLLKEPAGRCSCKQASEVCRLITNTNGRANLRGRGATGATGCAPHPPRSRGAAAAAAVRRRPGPVRSPADSIGNQHTGRTQMASACLHNINAACCRHHTSRAAHPAVLITCHRPLEHNHLETPASQAGRPPYD
jgi:hypothetical protein